MKKDSNLANRVHFLDSMRGILMLLGVLYHSALVFTKDINWAIKSNDTTEIAYWIAEFLHMYRMPVFFIISGYFILFTIRKYGINSFLKIRLKRILIPLITTALTLNIIQAYVINGNNWSTYYFDKGWISHLWFLWNLIFYFFITYFCYRTIELKLKFFSNFTKKLVYKVNIFILLIFFPLSSIFFLSIGKLLPKDILGLSIGSILYYFPFLLFGMIMLFDEKTMYKYINIKIYISFSVGLISYLLSTQILNNNEDILIKSASFYFKLLSVYFIGSLIFKFFLEFFNKESKILYFLAEASYSIYLFHHVLVIFIGSKLIEYNIGGIIGFLTLTISVSIISTFIHVLIIKKSKILLYLYNGK